MRSPVGLLFSRQNIALPRTETDPNRTEKRLFPSSKRQYLAVKLGDVDIIGCTCRPTHSLSFRSFTDQLTMDYRACERSGNGRNFRSPLTPRSVTPAHRSAPAHATSRSRSSDFWARSAPFSTPAPAPAPLTCSAVR